MGISTALTPFLFAREAGVAGAPQHKEPGRLHCRRSSSALSFKPALLYLALRSHSLLHFSLPPIRSIEQLGSRTSRSRRLGRP